MRALGYDYADIPVIGWVIAIIILVGLKRNDIPEAETILVTYATVGVAYMGAIRICTRLRFTPTKQIFIRIICMYLAIPILFSKLGGIIPYVNPKTYEQELIAIDRAIFNVDVFSCLESFLLPILVDVLQVVYAIYYILPLVVALAMMVKKDYDTVYKLMFAIGSAFVLSWVIYFLVPASSPYYAVTNPNLSQLFDFSKPIKGLWVGDAIREWIDHLEKNKFDAFPSAHAAVAMVCLLSIWRKGYGIFWYILSWTVLMLFSTLYLRYHYFVDILAGILVAILSLMLANVVDREKTSQ